MVSHDILIHILKFYGFHDNVIEWFKDYFYLRSQITVINGNESAASFIKHGVAQGSIIGPLLFILYLNDLPKVVRNCSISLYADDTCVYFASKDPLQLQKILTEDLELVTNWFSHNELILNERKCKFILFGSRKNLLKFQHVKVCINGHSLEITDELKYLGVILDKSLSWSPQIENTKSKILRIFFCVATS